MKIVDVHVEEAGAVAEVEKGPRHRRVISEEDLAAEHQSAAVLEGVEIGLRGGGVVQLAALGRSDLAVRHLHLCMGAKCGEQQGRGDRHGRPDTVAEGLVFFHVLSPAAVPPKAPVRPRIAIVFAGNTAIRG